jgi:two-component system, NarL family, invasion response regulator UvrY
MRILIADDHPIFRAGLKETLAKDPGVESIGEADDGHKAVELARKKRWDVVVLDIMMPGRDGLEVLQELRRERPKLPVLILSAHPEDQLALRLLKAGAAGYLTKEKAPEVLLAAIRKVASGGKYISESLAEKVVFACESEKAPHENLIESRISDHPDDRLRKNHAGNRQTTLSKRQNRQHLSRPYPRKDEHEHQC